MKINVIPFAGAVKNEQIAGKTVVVIDVLRATSVIITALQHGAKAIIPCPTVEDAIEHAKAFADDEYLLCGEREAKKIDGFHLGNSPLQFTRDTVENKTIILTTTNGTKALEACHDAKAVLIGAFINLKAVVDQTEDADELVLVCSGTRGRFSLDDGMCAAAIIGDIEKTRQVEPDDLGRVLLAAYYKYNGRYHQALRHCEHVKYLTRLGFAQDVSYCLKTNTSMLVPFYHPAEGRVYESENQPGETGNNVAANKPGA